MPHLPAGLCICGVDTGHSVIRSVGKNGEQLVDALVLVFPLYFTPVRDPQAMLETLPWRNSQVTRALGTTYFIVMFLLILSWICFHEPSGFLLYHLVP